MILRFNPRTPCGVRLGRLLACKHLFLFQSTHSLRSATHQIVHYGGALPVSIHALLAECDGGGPCLGPGRPGFNPRTPCGVRPLKLSLAASLVQFQSTHSLRSATMYLICVSFNEYGFNPRTPCGVRLISFRLTLPLPLFQSTHSLRSATLYGERLRSMSRFQSTHSLRSATPSTAAARLSRWFQSTHSLRSATRSSLLSLLQVLVSIHALLAECDEQPGQRKKH